LATLQLKHLQDYEGKQIQGTRDYQEDDFGFDVTNNDLLLMQLADGMGGYAGGDVASTSTIEAFMDIYDPHDGRTTAERLEFALNTANNALTKVIKEDPDLAGMGCTFVGAVLSNKFSRLHWISVGDSPFWLFRNGILIRLNIDHSKRTELKEQVEKGEITESTAAKDPERNSLTSALVGEKINLIDNNSKALEPGDVLLLASDGLLTLKEEEIVEILASDVSAENLTDCLLNAVKQRKRLSQDNTTVLIVKTPPPIKLEPKNIALKKVLPEDIIDIHHTFKSKKSNLKSIVFGILLIIALLLAFFAGSNFSRVENVTTTDESIESAQLQKNTMVDSVEGAAKDENTKGESKSNTTEGAKKSPLREEKDSQPSVTSQENKVHKTGKEKRENSEELSSEIKSDSQEIIEEDQVQRNSLKVPSKKDDIDDDNQGIVAYIKNLFSL